MKCCIIDIVNKTNNPKPLRDSLQIPPLISNPWFSLRNNFPLPINDTSIAFQRSKRTQIWHPPTGLTWATLLDLNSINWREPPPVDAHFFLSFSSFLLSFFLFFFSLITSHDKDHPLLSIRRGMVRCHPWPSPRIYTYIPEDGYLNLLWQQWTAQRGPFNPQKCTLCARSHPGRLVIPLKASLWYILAIPWHPSRRILRVQLALFFLSLSCPPLSPLSAGLFTYVQTLSTYPYQFTAPPVSPHNLTEDEALLSFAY